MKDSNHIRVEPDNLFLIKCHLKEREIDPGRNASYDLESREMKYFFNQDQNGDRNAEFYISDDSLFLRLFSPTGHTIDIEPNQIHPTNQKQSDAFESKYFPFISYNFQNLISLFCIITKNGEFKS